MTLSQPWRAARWVWSIGWPVIVVMVGMGQAPPQPQLSGEKLIEMVSGQKESVTIETNASRIDIATPGIVNVFMPNPLTLQLTGARPGFTTLSIVFPSGKVTNYAVRVKPADAQVIDQVAQEVAGFFRAYPSVTVRRVEDQVVLSGEIGRSDAPLLQQVSSMFSEIIINQVSVVDALPQPSATGGPAQMAAPVIISPSENQSIFLQEKVGIVIQASGFAQVRADEGSVTIASATGAPRLEIPWTPTRPGAIDLTVTGTTADGQQVSSPPRRLQVVTAEIALTSPPPGTKLKVNHPIVVAAKLSSPRGVRQVEFVATQVADNLPAPSQAPQQGTLFTQLTSQAGSGTQGSQLQPVLPTPQAPPFKVVRTSIGFDRFPSDGWTMPWTPTQSGFYQLSAVLTDFEGKSFESSTLPVRVIDHVVQIDVQILELNRNDALNLGVQWFQNPWLVQGNGQLQIQENLPTTMVGTFTFSNVEASIQALMNEGRARLLATPRLLVQSGQSASFLVGGSVPVVSTSTLGSSNVQYTQYGTQMQISPIVVSPNEIFINVTAQVSQLDPANAVDGNQALLNRGASTNLTAGSGNSFAIAGLLSSQSGDVTSKVPGLGDLPILGELFKFRSNTQDDVETVVLLTPYIVPGPPHVESLMPKRPTGIGLREGWYVHPWELPWTNEPPLPGAVPSFLPRLSVSELAYPSPPTGMAPPPPRPSPVSSKPRSLP